MSEKQKTAVEWFALELYEKFEMKGNGTIYDELLEKAKAIHQQQIQKAFIDGMDSDCLMVQNDNLFAEKYYKETYEH